MTDRHCKDCGHLLSLHRYDFKDPKHNGCQFHYQVFYRNGGDLQRCDCKKKEGKR